MSSAIICVWLWRRPRVLMLQPRTAPSIPQQHSLGGQPGAGLAAVSSVQHRGWHRRDISPGRAGTMRFLSCQGTVPGLGLLPVFLLGREIPVLAACRVRGCAWKAMPGPRESSVQTGQRGDVGSAARVAACDTPKFICIRQHPRDWAWRSWPLPPSMP